MGVSLSQSQGKSVSQGQKWVWSKKYNNMEPLPFNSGSASEFDLLYMPSDTLYGFKYKYLLTGIDAASRYKVLRPLRTKQARDMAEMIADIYKVGPLKYPKTFQCDNGSEFKGDVTKMLEKNEVKIRGVTTKYKHTHTAFVEALNKILAERLFKVQDAQELNDPE